MKITVYRLWSDIEQCSQIFATKEKAEKVKKYYENMYNEASEEDKEDYSWDVYITPVTYTVKDNPSSEDLSKLITKVIKTYYKKGWG